MGERGERRAREGREWEIGELYIYIDKIIVYYTYAFVYMTRDIGRARREARERGKRVGAR